MPAYLLLATLLAVAFTATASAQRTGTRIGRDATSKDGAAAMEILADCAVDRRPDLIRQWLNMLPGSPEETRLLSHWSADLTVCMESDELVLDGTRLSFKPIAMRLPVARILATRLLRSDTAATPPPRPAQIWFASQFAALPKDAKVDTTALGLQDFGYCVAQKEWTGVRALLLSEPASPEQAVAVKKLVPVLGPCLQNGVQISLTPTNLRSLLAEPVYHILAASPAEAAALQR